MQHVRDGRMPDTSKQEIKLFYCYAREDKTMRDELEKYLSSLKRLYSLRNWHDREIQPGQEWEQAIENSLNTAHLILLLIIPDFMNSEYCYGKEMQRALERHEEGTCKVIPIILRPTFLDAAPFHKLQMLPTDAQAITLWSNRDLAFHDVVKQINLVLKDLLLSLKSKKDWLDEGISFRSQKRYEYALEAFEQALRLDTRYLEAYQEKGMTLFELERYDYALEAFEQALHLNPNRVDLYIVKGQTLNALERYEDALAFFEQAIRLDPNNADAYIGRDKALQQLGVSRKAQEELARQLAQTRQQLVDSLKRAAEMESQLYQATRHLTGEQERSKELENLLAQTRVQKDEAFEQLGLSRKAQEELAGQPKKLSNR
jgi:tetratricopeptide (TPR) repeat protein